MVWEYSSVGNHTLFSHFGSSAQRLPNGNTLICATTEGYLVEVDSSGNVVWEYINPVTNAGIVTAIGDRLPMTNATPRATRYAAGFIGFLGHTLTQGSSIAGYSFPVISTPTRFPLTPTDTDSVWVTATVTDDVGVAGVQLTYSTGSGTATVTTAFTETMCSGSAVKPWTGSGAVNAWTVTGSYLEQRTGSNYGAGNAYGVEFKGGATLNALTAAMMATTNSINASGSSGYVEFYTQTQTLDGSDGWTFQLDSGSGFVTRLSELSGTSHTWQKYHYDLAAGELVSTLKMRFQFTGGGSGDLDDRIDLDQITVTVTSGGSSTSSVTMYDDGTHGDGLAGDHVYGAKIPAMPAGTTVSYYLTATNISGYSTISPEGAPSSTYSYTVLSSLDSVGDGIPNWWRAYYFGGDGKTAGMTSTASADPDGDGRSNYEEYIAGTDPTGPDSYFHILSTTKSASGFTVSFLSSASRLYTLYYSTDLVSGTWTAVSSQTNIPGTGGVETLTDPAPVNLTKEFYRVGVTVP